MSADAPVVATGIGRHFGRRPAVDGVDIRVEAGDRLALLGSNGAGKTTLLRILAGLLRPDRGELSVCGHRYPDRRDRARGAIGYLGHEPQVYLDLTPTQNLNFYADLYGLRDVPILDALDRVGLLARAHDRVRDFSRGMLQRLALARVELHAPRLLLLDEPFSGLDAPGVAALDSALDRIGSARAVILVSHDLEHVRRHCDRSVVLRSGQVVLRADPTAGDFERRYREVVR